MTAATNCRQLWQLLQTLDSFITCRQAVCSFHSSHMQSTALIAETSCQQFSLLKQALDNYDSCLAVLQAFHIFESFVKLLAAKKSYLIRLLISKGQIIKASTRLRVSEPVTDMGRLWSDLGPITNKTAHLVHCREGRLNMKRETRRARRERVKPTTET